MEYAEGGSLYNGEYHFNMSSWSWSAGARENI